MTGINKRSTDPRADQKKMKLNPLYNTSALIKAVGDKIKGLDKRSDETVARIDKRRKARHTVWDDITGNK